MFQEVFGSETLAGLKSNVPRQTKNNVEAPNGIEPEPNGGIEMREWVYQCAYERATELVEQSDIDAT